LRPASCDRCGAADALLSSLLADMTERFLCYMTSTLALRDLYRYIAGVVKQNNTVERGL
jgi:hypothetical protein